jgi:hypothetical protein
MGLWPFSMLGSVFSDLIIHIWDTLYNWMGGIYDTISRSVWKGTENDLASQEELATARKSGYWPPNL